MRTEQIKNFKERLWMESLPLLRVTSYQSKQSSGQVYPAAGNLSISTIAVIQKNAELRFPFQELERPKVAGIQTAEQILQENELSKYLRIRSIRTFINPEPLQRS